MREFLLLPVYVVVGVLGATALGVLTAVILIGGLLFVAAIVMDELIRGIHSSAQPNIVAVDPWWADDAECFLAAQESIRAQAEDRA